jgi:hypothetical protein
MSIAPPSSRGPADALRVLLLSGGHIVVVRRHVAVAIWRRAMDATSARVAHEALRDVVQRHPGEAVYVNVIRARVPPPNDDVRRELGQMVRSGEGALRCAAIVAQGNAFVVSLVRSVVAGVGMIVRPTFPMKVFGEAPEAAAWIGNLAGVPASAREVEIAIEEASAQLDARAAADRVNRANRADSKG